jgi:hypothetical protein
MSANLAPQVPTIVVGEVNNFAVSFAKALDSGELLAGTPTVVEEATDDLAMSNVAVNVAALKINGRPVEPGKAVQFRVAGQVAAHSPYTLRITVTTDGSPSQTKIRYIQFQVEP